MRRINRLRRKAEKKEERELKRDEERKVKREEKALWSRIRRSREAERKPEDAGAINQDLGTPADEPAAP